MNPTRIDHYIIRILRKAFAPFARISLFVVYTWFGILKIIGVSPAGDMVHRLFDATISFMSFETFYILFALFEILIGVLFLFPKAVRYVIPLLLLHMITTILPLLFLPNETWNGFMVLTLEGQYIVKNVIVIALAIGVAAHTHPLNSK